MNNNSSSTAITTYLYKDNNPVRTTFINEEVWFVAKDICDVLEIVNPSDAVKDFDDDEKGIAKIYTLQGMQNMTVISEPGVYTLVMKSRKPEAKHFSRWVRHEVLPSIRKTGGYGFDGQRISQEEVQIRLKELDAKNRELDMQGARIIQSMLDNPPFPITPETRTVFAHEVFRLSSGHECLTMLPECTDKWYTASELGSILGISANKVGRIAIKNGIKPPEGESNKYGRWIFSKSKHSSREVPSFIYSGEGLEWFREYLELTA